MITWHINTNSTFGNDTLDKGLTKAMNAANLNNHSLLKVVQCGRAVVIIPDSDVTAAAKGGEIMKMLGANERLIKYVRNDPSTIGNAPIEMELPKTANECRLDYTFYDDCRDLRNYVKITKEQFNFLEWLSNNGYLSYDMNWEYGHEIPDIETI